MSPTGRRGDTRERILDAAVAVLTELGLSRATTKEIAKAAGLSEAALYKHFPTKEELFMVVIRERVPGLADALAHLRSRIGEGSVRGNLEAVVRAALRFYRNSVRIAGSMFADPALLTRHREELLPRGAGPHKPIDLLAAHLADEKELGRIPRGVDTEAAAMLLMGACMQQAFIGAFLGRDPAEAEKADDETARRLVWAVMGGFKGL